MKEREIGEILKDIGKAALLGPIAYAKELRGKQLKKSDIGYFASLAAIEAVYAWPMLERYNLTGDPITSIVMYTGLATSTWVLWGEMAFLKKTIQDTNY